MKNYLELLKSFTISVGVSCSVLMGCRLMAASAVHATHEVEESHDQAQA